MVVLTMTECSHYVKHCNIIAPCCYIEYGCRLCHDETEDQ
ncbi:CHY zinc finger protein [Gregarina niphandrodes]|uniref:CHY zinc finger protein n=1 Tax=Gregarina niphandrodes TaxID=110365 RepID=A0A023B5H6_GRENI|nr:CHY zinc finger protein [Gregarina niphandrodes]EZG60247.1 CHY zinc finger protein [Gregarina niphandrodes]|eukprot:XP_011130850.1 CHY zinc finger protein [Gregarina niphandrodes]